VASKLQVPRNRGRLQESSRVGRGDGIGGVAGGSSRVGRVEESVEEAGPSREGRADGAAESQDPSLLSLSPIQ